VSERRRHRRVTFHVPATLRLGHEQSVHPASLMDISEGGLFLLVNDVVSVGKTATVRWGLAPDSVCEATGWVQRVLPFAQGQGVAIEFGLANDVLLHFLRNLAAATESGRTQLLGDIKDLVVTIV